MKMYKKVEELLYVAGTNTSKANKIAKVIPQCEDVYLKMLLIEYNRVLKLNLPRYKTVTILEQTPLEKVLYNKTIHRDIPEEQSLSNVFIYLKTLIKQHIQSCIDTNTPEWQVQALRAGWKPPH